MTGAEPTFFAGIQELSEGADIPLLLSFAAYVVRRLKRAARESHKHFGWRYRLSGLATTVFAGQTVWWALDYYSELSIPVRAAAAAMAAFSSDWLLDVVAARIRHAVLKESAPKRNRNHAED